MEKSHHFMIHLGSVQDVEDFVALATSKVYPVNLDDGKHTVNGKSFMEMFCLSLTQSLRVTAECSEEELHTFQAECSRFTML